MVIGMIGGFLFLLIQLVLIVDFAHAWNESWLGKYEESQSKWWFVGQYSASFYILLRLKLLEKELAGNWIKVIVQCQHHPVYSKNKYEQFNEWYFLKGNVSHFKYQIWWQEAAN